MSQGLVFLVCVLALTTGVTGCGDDDAEMMGAGGGNAGTGAGGTAGDDEPVNAMAGMTGGADEPVAGNDEPEPAPDSGVMDPEGVPYAMDECEIDTGYVGDEFCIKPPPADKGFQLRIGPADYNNPGAMFLLEPGDESTDDFPAVSGNTSDIHFLFRQFRMRPGTHHMITTAGGAAAGGGGEQFGGRRIATANASQDNPVRGIIAPENQGVGIPLGPSSSLNVSLHSINNSQETLLREIWVNFWYRDSALITEEATQLFAIGDVGFAVDPGADVILGPYSCDIQAAGRMLWFYGHRHANNKRFSAWRVRGTQRDLFYEGFDWEETLLLEYTSLITNAVPDRASETEGGWTGILDLQPGDKLEWECHVVNQQDNVLRFTNNTFTGEMCIMDAELVGTVCSSGFGLPGF